MSYQDHGFKKIEAQTITERDLEATLYEHIQTGARFMTLDNDDENKVFAVSFSTPVSDSLGIPHILEHSVLQGSRKYPLKEPFGELVKSSLATYINALTYPDKTLYPVASTNTKDFFNLVNVYLDAAFFPLLRDSDLSREGWHKEIDPDNGKLIYKGVVYNEMLGSYSSPFNEIFDEASSLIFPDTTYAHRSGGNPHVIPRLSHGEIRDFHTKYYHPSNCYAFFYGNDRSDERFRLLDSYFSQFEKQSIDSQITQQDITKVAPHLKANIMNYSDQNLGTTLRSYVFSPASETTDTLKRFVEAYYLLGTSGSPVYKALKDSELGEEVLVGSPDMGSLRFDSLVQKWALFGLKNVRVENFDAVQKLIDESIKEASVSIDSKNLLSTVSSLEYILKENDTGSSPRGIELIDEILSVWLYEGDPFEAMKYENKLAQVKVYLSDITEFQANLKKYWVEDSSIRRVDLIPSPEKKTQWSQHITDQLAAIQESLTSEEIATIKQNQANLKHEQETPDSPENLKLLPRLTIADLHKTNTTLELSKEKIDQNDFLYCQQDTNDIIYLELKLDCNHIPQDLIQYIPLYTQMLFETGTKNRSLSDLQFDIGTFSGGISISPSILTTLSGELQFWFDINLRCLPHFATQTGDIVNDVIHNTKINDITILKQLIIENRSGYESSLASNGNRYALRSVSGSLSLDGFLNGLMSGINQYIFLKNIDTSDKTQIEAIVNSFQQLHNLIFTSKKTLIHATTTAQSKPIAARIAQAIISNLKEFDLRTPNSQWDYHEDWTSKAFTISGSVNYVALGIKLKETGYVPSASLKVIDQYIDRSFLWEKIRLIGGAYGAMSSYNRIDDIYSFCSYRDPNLTKSLDTYRTIGETLKNLKLEQDEIDKNIIGTIGDFDHYLLPHQKGAMAFGRYLIGITDEFRREQRNQILSTKLEDFHHMGEFLTKAFDKTVIRIMGNEDQLRKELNGTAIEIIELLK